MKMQMRMGKQTAAAVAANSWLFPEDCWRGFTQSHTSFLQPYKTAQAAMFLSGTKQGLKKAKPKII